MRKFFYILLTIPLLILTRLADKENYSPVDYVYAETTTNTETIDQGTNCNSSAPNGISSNGDDGAPS